MSHNVSDSDRRDSAENAIDSTNLSSSSGIDRTKTCPFLLRCFWKLNQNNLSSDYRHVSKGIYPNQEVQIYTWMNATLGEIAELLKDAVSRIKEKNTVLTFQVVYVDPRGYFALRKVLSFSYSR
jgi:histone deacetylase complex subunit SAP18